MRLSLWWMLVGAGLIGGSWLDPVSPSGALQAGGYHVLRSDLHTHTRFGDGLLSPFEIVLLGRRHGLDAVAVTEHGQIFPARLAAWFSSLIGGPLVIVGQEVTTHGHHIVAAGITRRLDWRLPLPALLGEIRRQGGVSIAAHPTRAYWRALTPIAAQLDGVEVYNPLFHIQLIGSAVRLDEMRAFYAAAVRERAGLAAIASSDYHFFNAFGESYTLVFAKTRSSAAVIEAIRRGRTVVRTPDGAAFGPPSLIAAAERIPRLPANGYTARGPADAVFRLLGWLGLVGSVFLRGPYLRLGRRQKR